MAWRKGPVVSVFIENLGAHNAVNRKGNAGGKNDCLRKFNAVSPLSLLKNPMILIGVLGLAFVIGIPYLLENSTPHLSEPPLSDCTPFSPFSSCSIMFPTTKQ